MELRRVERLKLREIANLELRSLKLDRKPVLRHAARIELCPIVSSI
jgi:hypothetical protein